MADFFEFDNIEQFDEATQKLVKMVTLPRQVVKAYALRTSKRSDTGAAAQVVQFEKTPVYCLPEKDLKAYTGEALLKYDDGTTAICQMNKGKREGDYERYARFAGNSEDPMDKGPLLEQGQCVNDLPDGLWTVPLSVIGQQKFARRVQIVFDAGELVSASHSTWSVVVWNRKGPHRLASQGKLKIEPEQNING